MIIRYIHTDSVLWSFATQTVPMNADINWVVVFKIQQREYDSKPHHNSPTGCQNHAFLNITNNEMCKADLHFTLNVSSLHRKPPNNKSTEHIKDAHIKPSV